MVKTTEDLSLKTEFMVPAVPLPPNGSDNSVVPAAVASWGDSAGKGLEGVGQADYGRPPILRVLHYSCPQITEGDAKFVEGARPGMIYNGGDAQCIDGKIGGDFVPVKRDHRFVEFIPREAGGGAPVNDFAADDPKVLKLRAGQRFGKLMLENGNELTETFLLYGLFVPPSTDEHQADPWRVAIAFSSTQIKKYQVIMQRLSALVGSPPRFPIWAYKWHVSTQPESNRKGKFFGWRFVLSGGSQGTALLNPNDALVKMAQNFYEELRVVQADLSTMADTSDDSEIPF